MSAFDRLHPGLRRHLWDLRWKELRPIQVDAIEHILAERGDAVITAPTAGGKTEAAFLPVLSMIADEPGPGFRAIYVGAVKALINDQFRRLEELCSRLEVPVHRWHGDVHQGARRTAIRSPSGVLLITPESLEAMFVLRPTELPRMFGALAFVVVDELHAFMGTERGAQLRSLLHRLRRRCGCDPVRIGLSATIADPAAACQWLRPASDPATHIHDPQATREVAIRVRGYWLPGSSTASDREAEEEDEDDGDGEEGEDVATLRDIARNTVLAVHGCTTLAFANSKAKIEMFADALKAEIETLGVADEVVVHHGSLSKEIRESAEARLQRGRCLAVCSNTLELGIDIGVVDEVVQFTAPPSVASLAQRLGRSGRRGTAAHLRGFFTAQEPTPRSSVWDRLHLDFLRAVACVELLPEHFIEPVPYQSAHRSTLVQQILSELAASGGMSASALFELFSESACFGAIESTDFAALLRSLGRYDLIEQVPGNDLVVGLRGEKIVGHYEFFAAFKATEEVVVHDVSRGARVGMLPVGLVPPVGEYILLAGRRWQVVEIDHDRKLVLVKPGTGRRPPIFRSGVRDVDPAVHARMKALAIGDVIPTYLDDTACEILDAVREQAGLLDGFTPPRVDLGGSTDLFLWAGTRIGRTLYLWLLQRGIGAAFFDIGVEVSTTPDALRTVLEEFARERPDGVGLSRLADEVLGARLIDGQKYDEFLPIEMWQEIYAREQLDVVGAVQTVEQVLEAWGSTA